MGLSGFATPEGTDNYRRKMRENVADGHFRRVENLCWSSIGIGTYLGSADALTDRIVINAIIRSINGGINVIDTAINYRSQYAAFDGRDYRRASRRCRAAGEPENRRF